MSPKRCQALFSSLSTNALTPPVANTRITCRGEVFLSQNGDTSMRKTVTKWVVGAVILPVVMLALRKRINKYIDENL